MDERRAEKGRGWSCRSRDRKMDLYLVGGDGLTTDRETRQD